MSDHISQSEALRPGDAQYDRTASQTLQHQRGIVYSALAAPLFAGGGFFLGYGLAQGNSLSLAVGGTMTAAALGVYGQAIRANTSVVDGNDLYEVPNALSEIQQPEYPELERAERESRSAFQESLAAPAGFVLAALILYGSDKLQFPRPAAISLSLVSALAGAGLWLDTVRRFYISSEIFGNWMDRSYNFLANNKLGRQIQRFGQKKKDE
jgi:hypothetical protein